MYLLLVKFLWSMFAVWKNWCVYFYVGYLDCLSYYAVSPCSLVLCTNSHIFWCFVILFIRWRCLRILQAVWFETQEDSQVFSLLLRKNSFNYISFTDLFPDSFLWYRIFWSGMSWPILHWLSILRVYYCYLSLSIKSLNIRISS